MAPPLDRLNPPRRQTLADQVHAALSEMLLSGALRPRDRLSLRDLAERLDVSMMPVREAVSRLAAGGALEVSPKRAVMVPLMTAEAFADLTRVRVLTEGEAARLAARRASADEIAEIRALAARFEEVLDRAYGSAAAVAANKDLHFALYRAAGSPALTEVITLLWLRAGPIINYDIGAAADPEPARLVDPPPAEAMARARGHHSRGHHARLCAALKTRDGAAAAAAIAADINTAAELIRAQAGLVPGDGSTRRIIP